MCDSKNCPSGRHIGGRGYVCDHNNLKVNYSYLCKEWDDKNGLMENYSNGSGKKVLWVCTNNSSHGNWEAVIYDRTRAKNSTGCPSCFKDKQKLCDPSFSLLVLHPDLCKEFDYEKNGRTPDTISYGSKEQIYWICSINPFHKWKTSVNNRTINNTGCPLCCNIKRKICDPSLSLLALYPDLCKEFDYEKNKNTPDTIFYASNEKMYWICPKNFCHRWKVSVGHRTSNSKCPFCVNQRLCKEESCESCFDKSFASNEKSVFWSDKNMLNPRFIFKSSAKKCKFNCPYCNNLYESSLHNVTLGTWCGCTNNKTEAKLFSHLILCLTEVEKQKTFGFCKNKYRLRFDFVIEYFDLIIELDGIQHFRQVSNWKPPNKTQELDIHKMRCANDNGYSVIRILQKNVWSNQNNWQTHLYDAIESILFTKEKYKNIFITDSGPVYTFEEYCESNK